MPLYTFKCFKNHETDMIVDMKYRDSISPLCSVCERPTSRLHCQGKGLLYFEEGRARFDQGLGGAPITSPADRARRMRQQGVSEGNGVVPEAIRRNPKSAGMKRYLGNDKGNSWV